VRPERWLAGATLLLGTGAWLTYLQQGLVLSHYDAKAHLVVARRVVDSLTPGWQQLGAVWLPLPHLIQILPTQVDLFYRTGAFGSLLSIAAFGVAVWAAARLVHLMTGSALGAVTTAALLALNPNLLYLQSTPMTEPLLLALTLLAVLWLYESLTGTEPSPHRTALKLGCALFGAMWTRYEAWPIVVAAIALATLADLAFVRRRPTLRPGLIAWPAAAVLLFVINSRITVGSWFVSGGFYERDPIYDGQFWRSLIAVWWGTHQLSGYAIELIALIAAAILVIRTVRRQTPAASILPLALFAAGSLPFYAFYSGHPFRVRYMVPMVAACAVFCGIGVGLLRQSAGGQSVSHGRRTVYGALLAGILVASSIVESPPWKNDTPLLQEAQWDVPRARERRAVTACLAPRYHGEKVMASMGSLAHYMQELSQEGFAIRDFLHEGNGSIWQLAIETGPAGYAGWMLVEEQSEGGDVLAQRVREDTAFTHGMTRICEGGGLALYERTE
jgi:uncharacterized membrane protein (UPF0136 family)